MSDIKPLIVTAKFLAFVSYLYLRFEVLYITVEWWMVTWYASHPLRARVDVAISYQLVHWMNHPRSVKCKFPLSLHKRGTMYHMIWYYIIIIYKCGPCPVFYELYPGICLTTEGKTRKKPQLGYHNTQKKNYTNNQNTEQTSLTLYQQNNTLYCLLWSKTIIEYTLHCIL